jgi:glucose/arabinose dehydrogenase
VRAYHSQPRSARPFLSPFVIAAFIVISLLPGSCLDLSRAEAQTATDLPQIILGAQVPGFAQPVHVTGAGDGSGRLFVVEQPGRIRIVKNGLLLPTPLLDISATAVNFAHRRVRFGGEQGLLSVAFPPSFAQKRYFYVNYTRQPDGATVVARYFLTANPDVANPASEQVILTVAQPFANHNGGQLAFGPVDGFLYIGMGDGGSGGDPNNLAQNLADLSGNQRLLGKMLRIDVESGFTPYAVPSSNPLLGGRRSEIWSLGLRNPFRFSFDSLTGDLYIGDVGQNLFEEIDFQPAASTGGENYGWRIMEGFSCFNTANFGAPLPSCNQSGLTLPVLAYAHAQGNCSVTGGTVYRGTSFSRMQGIYFYGDFCTGRIWGLTHDGAGWHNALLLDTAMNISTFGEDDDGELYVADLTAGIVHKIIDFDRAAAFSLVTKYYNDILGRAPEPGGAELWTSEVERVVSLGIDVREGFQGLANFFFDSSEYALRKRTPPEFVADLYQTFFSRPPDPEGEAFWLGQLAAGLTRTMLVTEFAHSDEFTAFLQNTFSVVTTRPENNLVNDFYRGFLNRFPDNAGFNHWLAQMQAAQCAGATAVRNVSRQIATDFFRSPEYTSRARNNEGFVEDLYNAILARGADASGFVHWIDMLNAGRTRIQVLNDFIASPEFSSRVDNVIAAGCP